MCEVLPRRPNNEHVMHQLFSANRTRFEFNRSTEDFPSPWNLPQALRPTERAYKRDAYPKRAMLSEGLRASVKFVVVLYFVIVMRLFWHDTSSHSMSNSPIRLGPS